MSAYPSLLNARGLVLVFLLGLLRPGGVESDPWAADDPYPSHAHRYKPLVLEAWRHRMDSLGGVHPWRSAYSGSRVFQEWAAVLTDAAGGGEEERALAGEKLRRYVLQPPISAWGRAGTSLPFAGSDGDFDMTLVACLSLLGLFENDTLSLPNPVFLHLLRHVNGLFGQVSSQAFDVGLLRFPETENHVFMTEGCRALANDMVLRNSRKLREIESLRDSLEHAGLVLENARGGLNTLLLKMMSQVVKHGFFEINARIYQRFTLHALLNLHAFASDSTLRTGAAVVLDYFSALFALQSQRNIRWGPYRRSSETFNDSTLFDRDAVASFFAAHSGVIPWDIDPDHGLWVRNSAHAGMALWACVMPYRIPIPILSLLRGDKPDYQAEVVSGTTLAGREGKITETYGGGADYLVVGGGTFESYGGPNFPTPGGGLGKGPWVYDYLNRPSALLVATKRPGLWDMRDILTLRGSMWHAPPSTIRGRILLGVAEWQGAGSPVFYPGAWGEPERRRAGEGEVWHWRLEPAGQRVWASWPQGPKKKSWFAEEPWTPVAVEIWPDSFSFADSTGRDNPRPTPHWRRGRRGDWEYQAASGAMAKGRPSAKGWEKVQWQGYSPPPWATPPRQHSKQEKQGAPAPMGFPYWPSLENQETKPAWRPCLGRQGRLPHVRAYVPDSDSPPFVCADGQGHFYAYHSSTGGYTVANFSLWWRPLRRVYP